MKKTLLLPAMLLGALCSSAPLQAAMSWSSQLPQGADAGKGQATSGAHAHGGPRRGTPFLLHEAAGASAQIWLPTLVRRPLHINAQGVAEIAGTGVLNYHLLYARRQGDGVDELALRYHYLNGKPSGESPRLLLGYRKGALDIVPSPLTREHQRYQGGKKAIYTLLFKNGPLAAQPLILTTSNGTTLQLASDSEGRVVVPLPDDFTDVQPGRAQNRPAEFVLTTRYLHEGTEYRTTLSGDYHVNPSHWQSMGGGLLAMLAGFAGGLLVIRRQRNAAQENRNA
jgi:hypothetical protein